MALARSLFIPILGRFAVFHQQTLSGSRAWRVGYSSKSALNANVSGGLCVVALPVLGAVVSSMVEGVLNGLAHHARETRHADRVRRDPNAALGRAARELRGVN